MPQTQTFTDVQPIPQTFSNVQPIEAQPIESARIGDIKAEPKPTGMADKFTKWTENVANDIKYGTDQTGIGTLLKKMGAHGVYNGNSEEVGNFMASLPLGLNRMATGTGQVFRGEQWKGGKNIVGGALEAATIPAAMGSPFEAEAAAQGATKLSQAAAAAMPGAKLAAATGKFQELEGAIGQHTVHMTDELKTAFDELKEFTDVTGRNPPPVVNKLMTRMADINQAPLSYKEARMAYSDLSDLSATDKMMANKKMNRLLIPLKRALGDTIESTAEKASLLQKYQEAMKGFARGKILEERMDVAKEIAKKGAIGAAGGALGIGAGIKGYYMLKDLLGGR